MGLNLNLNINGAKRGLATPPVPTDVAITVVSDTEFSIAYVSAKPVEIWYSTTQFGVYTKHGDSASTPYPMTGLTAGTEYWVKVRGVNGSKFSAFTDASSATTNPAIDIDYLFAEHAVSPLSIPTYVTDNEECLHPDVYDFTTQWNGYRYWMAFTPLPGSVEETPSQFENPSIVASNDKLTWVVPDGLTNPIREAPAVGYNADTTLFYEDGYLYCFYRTWISDPVNRQAIAFKKSSDGITWLAEDDLNFVGIDNISLQLISPSFIKFNNKYYLIAFEKLDTAKNAKIIRLESTTLVGAYSNPTYLTITESNSLVSEIADEYQYPWHGNFKVINNKVVGIVYYRGSSTTKYNVETIFMAISDDLATLVIAQQPIFTRWYGGQSKWDTSSYRSAFLPKIVDNEYKFDLWYPGWINDHEIYPVYIGYTEIQKITSGLNLGATNTINAQRLAELVSAKALGEDYTFGDDINRDDGNINPTPCAVDYQIGAGTIAIASNYIVNSVESVAANLIFTVPVNYEMKLQMINGVGLPLTGTDGGFRIWVKTLTTGKFLDISDGVYNTKVIKIVTGGTTYEQARIYRPFRKNVLTEIIVRLVGANLKYYANGKLLFDKTFTAADVGDSQAALDEILNTTTMRFLWTANTSAGAKIKNITIKEITV